MIAEKFYFPHYGLIMKANLIGFHPPEISKSGEKHNELAKDALLLISLLGDTLSGRDAICVGQHGLMAMISTGIDQQSRPVLSIARDRRKMTMTYQPGLSIITNENKHSLFQVPTKYNPQFVLASIDFLNSLK